MLENVTTRRWLATGTTALVAVLGLGAYSAVAATPAHQARATHRLTTGDYGVVIGPLRARDGFKVEIEAFDCGTKDGGVIVAYEKGTRTAELDQSYARSGDTCTVSKKLTSATLKVHWGTALKLDVKIATTRALDKTQTGDLCTGSHVEYRGAKATGTAVLAIHTQAFGRIVATQDEARVLALVHPGSCDSAAQSTGTSGTVKPVSSGGGFSEALSHSALDRAGAIAIDRAELMGRPTPAPHGIDDTVTTPATTTTTTTTVPGPTTTVTTTTTVPGTTPTTTAPPTVTPDKSGTQFLGIFDDSGRLMISALTEAPSAPLLVINDEARDAPAAGVQGSMTVAIYSARGFTVAPGDAGAQVRAAATFARGALVFTPTGLCHGTTDALDGTLSGSIVVKDPVYGTITYSGPKAVGAVLGNGDADLDGC